MRTAIVAVIALLVGAVAAVIIGQQRLAAQSKAFETERSALNEEVRSLKEKLASAEFRADDLDRQARRAAMRSRPERPESPPEEIAAPEELMEEGDTADDILAAFTDGDSGEEQRRGGPEDERRRAEWRERAQRFMTDMRNRTADFLATQIEATDDTATQQRLLSIGENLASMFDLGMQMREAQSDEDRDALRDAMHQTRDNLETLVQEQRAHMISEVASQHGVTDPAEQQALAADMAALQNSPFFQPHLAFGGGPGRGGPRGRR